MLNRRLFVQTGVAAAALVGDTMRFAPADGLARASGLSLHTAIYDHRFAAGRQFAHNLQAQGVSTRAIAGDVTSVWYEELHPLWKQRRVTIAGFTTYAPLFCLERLAWDHGMRVIHREQHQPSARNEPSQLLYSWIIR